MDTLIAVSAFIRRGRGAVAAKVMKAARRSSRGRNSVLKNQSGSSLVEMALVLPVFFLLLTGMFEISILLFTYCNATYAVRTAARYAGLHSSTSLSPCTSSGVGAIVTSNLFLDSSETPVVTVAYSPTNSNIIGNKVQVAVVWTYTLPFVGSTIYSANAAAFRVITR